jgi:hypothetical protein
MSWPALPLAEWDDTRETLHRWMQIVGKIRMVLSPPVNHWWHVPLYLTARGLTTSAIPYGERWFDMEFDFVSHVLRTRVSDGAEHDIPLGPRSVADLHDEIFSVLRSIRIACDIDRKPSEIVGDTTPFDSDHHHNAYDREAVVRFWRALARSAAVFSRFRSGFIGKCSPVHFFWGSFDLAVTRFSGRRAPERPKADAMTREAYSHEVSSAGFWPGDHRYPKATYYAYAAPEPQGFRDVPVDHATFLPGFGGFYLDYDTVRTAADPEQTLLTFCEQTYDAAARLGHWDRAALERR